MITLFENYDIDKKYMIVCNSRTDNVLIFIMKGEPDRFAWWEASDKYSHSDIQYYTYDDAVKAINVLERMYNNIIFRIITYKELDTELDANKYNL